MRAEGMTALASTGWSCEELVAQEKDFEILLDLKGGTKCYQLVLSSTLGLKAHHLNASSPTRQVGESLLILLTWVDIPLLQPCFLLGVFRGPWWAHIPYSPGWLHDFLLLMSCHSPLGGFQGLS